MTERNQLGCPFCGHDPGKPCNAKNVAFGRFALQDKAERFGLHFDAAFCNSLPDCLLFAAYRYHAGRAAAVKMAQVLIGLSHLSSYSRHRPFKTTRALTVHAQVMPLG